jgi:DNA-directed RNA polymerase subunit RPC12/RpoP
MAGIPKAWKEMKEYQIQDVNLLLDLYDILLPWIKNHPHVGASEGKPEACRNCGHNDLRPNGSQTSSVGKYKKYKCSGCGAHHKGQLIARGIYK